MFIGGGHFDSRVNGNNDDSAMDFEVRYFQSHLPVRV